MSTDRDLLIQARIALAGFPENRCATEAYRKITAHLEGVAEQPSFVTGHFYAPKGYTVGTTYPLGDTPSAHETGEPDFTKRFVSSFSAGRHFRAVPTGEKRAPKAGEWYLSGSDVTAYKMPNDGITTEYMIAKLVRVERVPAVETYRIIG